MNTATTGNQLTPVHERSRNRTITITEDLYRQLKPFWDLEFISIKVMQTDVHLKLSPYKLFKTVQSSLRYLRFDLLKQANIKRLRGSSRSNLFDKNVGFLMQKNVLRWGLVSHKFDLHFLRAPEALGILRNVFRNPQWMQVRVVSGKGGRTYHKRNCSRHVDVLGVKIGILNFLLHYLFSKKVEYSNEMKRGDFKSFIEWTSFKEREVDGKVTGHFSSNDCAVLLTRTRE